MSDLIQKTIDVVSSIGSRVERAVEVTAQGICDKAKEATWLAAPIVTRAERALRGDDDVHLSPDAQAELGAENVDSATQLEQPARRATVAYDSMMTNMGGPSDLRQNRNGDHANAWTYGQVMTAALDRAKLTGDYSDFDKLAAGLEKYKSDDGGYAPDSNGVHGKGRKYYDDNAWIGLTFMQAYEQRHDPADLKKAEASFSLLEKAVAPGGGLEWVEGDETVHTCSTGPATELALRLHMASTKDPSKTDDKYFKFADQLDKYADQHLRDAQGLYIDSRAPDGTEQKSIWSYNQGAMIGAKTLFYRATGDPKYLAQAQQTADASLNHLAQNGELEKQPPCFNAIYFRNLMHLDAVAPDARYRDTMTRYTDDAWHNALDPQSGLFDKPSRFGAYGSNHDHLALDQAGLVQLYAIEAMPREALRDIS